MNDVIKRDTVNVTRRESQLMMSHGERHSEWCHREKDTVNDVTGRETR